MGLDPDFVEWKKEKISYKAQKQEAILVLHTIYVIYLQTTT